MPRAVVRSEASIQKAVVAYAKQRGCIAIKQSTAGRFGTAGWPDYLIISLEGRVMFMEFKRQGGEPTPLQDRRMSELRGNMIDCYVVDEVSLGKALVDGLCL